MMFDTATDTAFLRTILADPDDDAPRLIYADWLDEQGDADRAEFIRLQVQLSRMLPGEPGWGPMFGRSHELKQLHHVEWVNKLPQFDEVHWEIFERGFIKAARVDSPDAYFDNAGKLFAAAPIEELRLHQFTWVNATRLAESKHLRRIRVLDFGDGNRVANQGTEALAKSPYLANLVTLNLSQNSLGSAGVRAIAMAPYIRSLRELKLDRNDLYDDALRYIAESSNFAGLEMLDMDFTRTGDDGVRALARTKHVKRLRSVYLNNNLITDASLIELIRSDVLAGVRVLFLNGNQINDAGIAAIVSSPSTANIERLYLRRNHISDKGAFALSRWERGPRLRELHIGGNRISELGWSELTSHLGKAVNDY
jgi:uncharacterized protein (TIGR02996 family)